jgi:hypothetical protein
VSKLASRVQCAREGFLNRVTTGINVAERGNGEPKEAPKTVAVRLLDRSDQVVVRYPRQAWRRANAAGRASGVRVEDELGRLPSRWGAWTEGEPLSVAGCHIDD